MKALFTRALQEPAGGPVLSRIASRAKHRERDVWQRRFWEHTIRDERDLEHHLNYLHFNPVKHGLCECPHAWAASSFHKWVERNAYAPDWCCACHGQKFVRPYPQELDAQMGE